jgi:hypothetical protein
MEGKQAYERKKSGAHPCKGRLYNLYHGKNITYKFCKKRGWIRIEQDVNPQSIFKIETFEDKVLMEEKNLTQNKLQQHNQKEEEIKKQISKKEENKNDINLAFIVNNYDKEQQYSQNEQRKVNDYRIYNLVKNKANKKEEIQRCPLCGSAIQQKSEEYSKAA